MKSLIAIAVFSCGLFFTLAQAGNLTPEEEAAQILALKIAESTGGDPSIYLDYARRAPSHHDADAVQVIPAR